VGFGLLQSQDVAWAAQAIEQGLWTVQACQSAELPAQFGYVKSPQNLSLNPPD
jgi:hypothetical protein